MGQEELPDLNCGLRLSLLNPASIPVSYGSATTNNAFLLTSSQHLLSGASNRHSLFSSFHLEKHLLRFYIKTQRLLIEIELLKTCRKMI